MRIFIKNSYLFLILTFLLLSKDFFYGLIMPKDEIDVSNIYIKNLEKEIEDLKVVKDYNYNLTGVYGKILYKNPYKNKEEVVILTDTKDIDKNNYIITNNGLIGIVDNVYKNHIIARLLTNKDVILQIKVNDCYGVFKYPYIDNVSNYCNINEGDIVYTSNLGYFLEFIEIGKIKNVIKDKNGINNIYEVKLSAEFNNLNYVMILTKE